MNPVRVIVTGDRHWQPTALARAVIVRLIAKHGVENLIIVHGNAPGVDLTFDAAAQELGVAREPHAADWDQHGKGAGPRRNAEMCRAGADLCIAVHRDLAKSKGTRGCVRLSVAAGIPTWLIDSESGIPKRLDLETAP